MLHNFKGIATGTTSKTWALPLFYWASQEVIIQWLPTLLQNIPIFMVYQALYLRQDQGQQSMKQRCPLNERKDKSLAFIELI